MLVEDAPLSADELAHLKVVAPSLLAGQRWGFWLLANAVALAWIAALLVVAAPNPEGFRRELVLPLLVAWLGLNGFFFWRRHVSRGLRGDVAAPRKQIIRGDAGGLVASDNALTYTVGGEGWRVYPALPLGSGFVVGRLRIETVAGVGGTAVTLQRTSQGERLLGVRYPAWDDTATLRHEAGLSATEQRLLTRRAHRTGVFLALGVGGVGLLLGLQHGVSPWLALWLLPALALYVLARMADGPQHWVGWVTAQGPVTETLRASWRGPRHRIERGCWVRVAGQLFPVSELPALGATVRLRARLRADGWPGETTEFDTLPEVPDGPPVDAQWGA